MIQFHHVITPYRTRHSSSYNAYTCSRPRYRLLVSLQEVLGLLYMEGRKGIDVSESRNERARTCSAAIHIIGSELLFGISTLLYRMRVPTLKLEVQTVSPSTVVPGDLVDHLGSNSISSRRNCNLCFIGLWVPEVHGVVSE